MGANQENLEEEEVRTLLRGNRPSWKIQQLKIKEITLDERDKKIKETMNCNWKSPSVSSYILVNIYINYYSSLYILYASVLFFL